MQFHATAKCFRSTLYLLLCPSEKLLLGSLLCSKQSFLSRPVKVIDGSPCCLHQPTTIKISHCSLLNRLQNVHYGKPLKITWWKGFAPGRFIYVGWPFSSFCFMQKKALTMWRPRILANYADLCTASCQMPCHGILEHQNFDFFLQERVPSNTITGQHSKDT